MKTGMLGVGDLEYAVKPVLLEDHSVQISLTIARRMGEKPPEVLAAPQVITKLGDTATMRIGELEFKLRSVLSMP